MKTLDQLGLEHGTDKASSFHGYLNTYERYLAPLRDKPIRLLEIGVLGGASLKMWRDYFPNGQITGLDCDDLSHLKLGERIQILRGDASSEETWLRHFNECAGKYDLIVDDGFHSTYAIIKAFTCGFPLLKPGGLWIVEDLHAGHLSEMRRDNSLMGLSPIETATNFFAEFAKRLTALGGQCGKEDRSAAEMPFAFIHFWKSLIVIGKR